MRPPKGHRAFYSHAMDQMSVSWDDEHARGWQISGSSAWRSALRRAATDPFVGVVGHEPSSLQAVHNEEAMERENENALRRYGDTREERSARARRAR